jgi:hypothetical protein
MGADAFLSFYGIKISLDPDDETVLNAIEDGTDPRLRAADRAGLDTCFGRMTDGEDHFLFIGHNIGWLGLENDYDIQIGMQKLTEISLKVQAGLRQAGFTDEPAFHLQLDAQY